MNIDFKDEKKAYLYLRYISACIFVMFWYFVGPIQAPDSYTYIHGNEVRSPLYPLIIQMVNGNLSLLVLLQLALGLFAAHYLLVTLKEIFRFTIDIAIIVLCLLLYPYCHVLAPSVFYMGNYILTEPICYPLFLLALAFLFKGITQGKLSQYIAFIVFSGLLVLTRRQFLFLYPIFAIVFCYVVLIQKPNFSKILLLAIFVSSILFTNVLEKTYQYVQHGKFVTIPFTGKQMLISALFVAKEQDEKLFHDPTQKEFFINVHEKMSAMQITFKYRQSLVKNYISYYEYFNYVLHGVVPEVLKSMNLKDVYVNNAMFLDITFRLIQSNFKDYVKLYVKNIQVNMGSRSFVLFLISMYMFSFLYCLRYGNAWALVFFLTVTMHIGNYMLVGLVEPIKWRYSLYTNFPLAALLAIFVGNGMKKCKP